jgi:hypothetical protein
MLRNSTDYELAVPGMFVVEGGSRRGPVVVFCSVCWRNNMVATVA